MQLLKRNRPNDIWVEEYEDRGVAVANSTGLGTLYKQDGTPVTGAINLVMSYTAAAGEFPARYLGTVPHTVALPDESYDLRGIITNVDGTTVEFNQTCIVEDG